jgi:hypothetical protein
VQDGRHPLSKGHLNKRPFFGHFSQHLENWGPFLTSPLALRG